MAAQERPRFAPVHGQQGQAERSPAAVHPDAGDHGVGQPSGAGMAARLGDHEVAAAAQHVQGHARPLLPPPGQRDGAFPGRGRAVRPGRGG